MIRRCKFLVVLGLMLSFANLTWGEAPGSSQRPSSGSSAVPLYQFDIPAGPLGPALNRLAMEAGLVMYFDPYLVQGKETMGIQGRYSITQGFSALLKGSGLIAIRSASGHYTVSPVISGESSPSEVFVTLDALEVYASTETGKVYQTPAAVSVVSQEQIKRLPPRNTSDVLTAVPGVNTSQSRQDPGVSVNIRGLQDFGRVNMMIDGTRQNFQRSGHGSNGALYMDPQLLGGVEVSKGPSSTLGGAAVIGGVVNFRTLEFEDLVSDDKDYGGRLNATTGSNAYHFSGSLAGAARITEDLDLVIAAGRKNVGAFEKGRQGGNADNGSYWEGTSQYTGQDQWSGLLKGTWRFTEEQQVKLSYIGFNADFEEGSNTDEGAIDSKSRIRTDTFLTNYEWSPSTDWVDLKSSLYYTRTRNDQYRPETQDPSNPYGEFNVRYETNTLGGTLVNQSLLDLPEYESIITFNYGTEFYYDWTRPQTEQLSEGEGRAEWISGPTPEGDRWLTSLFTRTEFSHASGLDLIAGLRYDYFSLEGNGEMYVGSIDNPPGVRPSSTAIYTDFNVARHQGYFSPTFTAAYQFKNIQVFANYGLGIRPPSITETLMWGTHVGNSFPFFPNPGLEPERSHNLDVGMNMRWQALLGNQDQLNLKAVWFDNRVDNYITQAQIMGPASTNSNSMAVAFVNLEDRVRNYGIEFQAEYESRYYFAEFSLTRTHSDLGRGGYDPFPLGSIVGYPPTDHGEANGGGLMYVPPPSKKIVFTNGLYLLDRSLILGARLRLEDNEGRGGTAYESVVDWEVYDLWLRYEASHWLTLNVAVDNLTDRNYAELNGTSYWIAPGRTATATITLTY
ncbi:TonB-dependent receptor [Hahella ganghwensis]|uniref:TonB-dependent receptor n=1 Tax=Hahella ganghwensis TaxID=286420 RepID=UPI00036844BC|nr:TonB-dependent receptor [Hahella ganghwensis]